MTGAETSGGDLQKAAAAFNDGAGQIQSQAEAVAQSRITAKQAGRDFADVGDAYQQALDKLEASIKSFAEGGTTLAQNFTDSATEYQSSDDSGATALGTACA